MIHQIVYAYMSDALALGWQSDGSAGKPKQMNPWKEVKKVLENTGDTIIWIITLDQSAKFIPKIEAEGLDKFLVVDHRKFAGSSNRNYPTYGRRLRVFIMKGIK